MKKRNRSVGTVLLVMLVVVLGVSTFVTTQRLAKFNQAAVFSVDEVQKSLQRFEEIIQVQGEDLDYYINSANGFIPSFIFHLVTTDRFVKKYPDFYYGEYTDSKDSMTRALEEMAEIQSEEEYREALETFEEEMETFDQVLNYLKEKEIH